MLFRSSTECLVASGPSNNRSDGCSRWVIPPTVLASERYSLNECIVSPHCGGIILCLFSNFFISLNLVFLRRSGRYHIAENNLNCAALNYPYKRIEMTEPFCGTLSAQ